MGAIYVLYLPAGVYRLEEPAEAGYVSELGSTTIMRETLEYEALSKL
jgi:hypothetical protein